MKAARIGVAGKIGGTGRAGKAGVVALAFLLLFSAFVTPGAQSAPGPFDPVAAYRSGMELLARGETYRAVDAFMAAVAANPSYAAAWAGLAESHYELGEFDRAIVYVNEAARFGPQTPALLNLHAFSLVGIGKVDESRELFERILQSLPNDRDARFGLALLDVRRGRPTDARIRLASSLRSHPRDSRALLTLALISKAEGRASESAAFLAEALRWTADDPETSYAAAVLALENGNVIEAARLAQAAVDARPNHGPARSLLAGLYYERGAWDQSREVLDAAILHNREDAQAWFLLGLVEAAAGRPDQAELALSTLVAMRPDDELARIALENLVMDATPMEDARRNQYAAWRFGRAAEFERGLLYERALAEYRRGLSIDPYSVPGRRRYAELLRLSGLAAAYHAELAFLKDLGKADQAIEDALEIYGSLLQGGVSVDWRVDQFSVLSRPYTLAVYSVGPGGLPYHAGSDLVVARYLRDLLSSSARIAPSRATPRVAAFSDAYRMAREAGMDYFILLRTEETERDVLVLAELYVGRTGALVARLEVPRSGNDRIAGAVAGILYEVSSLLHLRGSIVERRGELALVDIGRSVGVAAEDAFLVIRNGRISTNADAAGLSWAEADVVGRLVITRVDDEIAEGRLERVGFFDRVNPRDVIVREPAPDTEPEKPPATASADRGTLTWMTLFEKIQRLY
ncbi:MAG: tetratricopeptide repeat protein [Spirochaetia bacterium]|nr:tetratricopeptide repeat protein [Spirochaetia bacterium]